MTKVNLLLTHKTLGVYNILRICKINLSFTIFLSSLIIYKIPFIVDKVTKEVWTK